MSAVDVALSDVVKEFPSPRENKLVRAVDHVSLKICDGEFFALLGPSGCGKTTTLRLIAGFEEPTSGEILIRGQSVGNIPPFHRPVNTVFQDYALFPHMTVLDNVMFGLRMENVPKKEAVARARDALELVQLPALEDRKPRQLSGGQQQRVALARALVKQPAVLLLDEPLGALDLKLRKSMQFELKNMQQRLGITFIYVTHDQEEAMTMSDRIAVMNHGKVLQIGTPSEIYEKPVDQFVADFIGETNFIHGILQGQENGMGLVRLDDSVDIRAINPAQNPPERAEVVVAIRPEKISLFPTEGYVQRAEGLAVTAQEFKTALEQNTRTTLLKGIILEALYIGTDTRYVIKIGERAEIVARIQNFSHRFDTLFEKGQDVFVFWDTENARILSS